MAKEYLEAAKAYERARDMDSVVRLLLDHLNAPERAAAIVRQTRSSEGATLIARYCTGVGDFRGAIEFLLLAKKRDDAFALASSHGEMELYVQALRVALAATVAGTDPTALLAAAATGGETAAAALSAVQLPLEECVRVAGYYETKSEWAKAGHLYGECGNYAKAVRLYLQCGETEIDRAIEVVGKAKNEAVTHALIDYLTGETDGVTKDARYIFKLYLALGNYPKAAKTALVIANQEQELGNYKVAHSILYETHRDLETHKCRVPLDMLQHLTLLHSYLLVKRLVRQDNHEAAAHMMVRVAKSVSKFPLHIVPILTSTVIECQRAGMKRSAYEYSAMLMRPEYRDAVDPKLYKKIEALVRRPSAEEADQPLTPCPFCDHPVPAYQLQCDSCKANIPFCIATGKHMTLEDCSSCPNCKWPALYTALAALLSVEPVCPMCTATVPPTALSLSREPLVLLRRAAGQLDDGGGDGDDGDQEGDAHAGRGGGGGGDGVSPKSGDGSGGVHRGGGGGVGAAAAGGAGGLPSSGR